MDIGIVTTSQQAGTFRRSERGPNLITLDYCLDRGTLTDDSPRVYLFTSDGIIKKIGGSASRGGLRATMSFYLSSQQGAPGVPRFVIHHLIRREIDEGRQVQVHVIVSPSVLAQVSGLFEVTEAYVSSFKEMEDKCKLDYFNRENRYPDWNFQENATPYPEDLARLHNEYHQRRLG